MNFITGDKDEVININRRNKIQLLEDSKNIILYRNKFIKMSKFILLHERN